MLLGPASGGSVPGTPVTGEVGHLSMLKGSRCPRRGSFGHAGGMTATPSQSDQPAGTVRTVHGEPSTTEINEAGEAELARREDTAANQPVDQPASSEPETREPRVSESSAPTSAPDEHEAKAPHRAKS